MRKALSTPAIVFKGSGWAKKDQRDKVHASSKATATPAATRGRERGAGQPARGRRRSGRASTSGTRTAGRRADDRDTIRAIDDRAAPPPRRPPATSSTGSAASSG